MYSLERAGKGPNVLYIDLFFLLLLSIFLGLRLWGMLGKNGRSKGRGVSKFFIVPQTQVTIEKEMAPEEAFYPGFNESHFLSGVEKAFERIQVALKEQDKEKLSALVASDFLPTLLKSAATSRDSYEAICLLSATIQERKIQEGEAFIAVQLTSQQTYQEKIWTVEETWVLKRALTSLNPNWFLCEVRTDPK